ncbi:hypothetical protein ISS86_03070 [Candidatus Microgenomates bacterium]|nr:hypothetical protein [Candidatus Microgenomates bacterium]
MFSNRLKIILLATIFNLSFEYSMRGIGGFFKLAFFPLILFGFYFTLYSMLEDLIVRFKLHNYQLVLAAFLYGIFPMAFATGVLFNKPQFLGINWTALFYVGFLWWGILQAIFTFYFASRLVQRDWNHPKMGKLSWFLAITYNVVVFAWMKRVNPYLAAVQSVAYLIFILIAAITAFFLQRDLGKNKDRKPWQFEPSTVMDFLSFGSFILFVFLGTYFAGGQVGDPRAGGSHVNLTAVRIVHFWTILYSIIFLVYRWWRGKEIAV